MKGTLIFTPSAVGEDLVDEIAWINASLYCDACDARFAVAPDDWTEAIISDWACTTAHEAVAKGWVATVIGEEAMLLCPKCAEASSRDHAII